MFYRVKSSQTVSTIKIKMYKTKVCPWFVKPQTKNNAPLFSELKKLLLLGVLVRLCWSKDFQNERAQARRKNH